MVVVMTTWLNDHQIKNTPKVTTVELTRRQKFESKAKKPKKKRTTLSQQTFGDIK
jgi:hypothetical protein